MWCANDDCMISIRPIGDDFKVCGDDFKGDEFISDKLKVTVFLNSPELWHKIKTLLWNNRKKRKWTKIIDQIAYWHNFRHLSRDYMICRLDVDQVRIQDTTMKCNIDRYFLLFIRLFISLFKASTFLKVWRHTWNERKNKNSVLSHCTRCQNAFR